MKTAEQIEREMLRVKKERDLKPMGTSRHRDLNSRMWTLLWVLETTDIKEIEERLEDKL